MANHSMNRLARDMAIEQSLDAAIEMDGLIAGTRDDSPALLMLIHTLLGAPSQDVTTLKRDLLSDSQFASLSHRAASAASGKLYSTTAELDEILSLLLTVNSKGLSNFTKENQKFIKDFCLGLNQDFVAEAFGRIPRPPHDRFRPNRLVKQHEH